MPDEEDIDLRFGYHRADTDKKVERHADVRNLCREFGQQLNEMVPEGREKALAFTKVEEAMFWANAAVARHYA